MTTDHTSTDRFNAAERVAAGAAFLDDQQPGWIDVIDLDKLDLSSSCRCVLGQLEIHLSGNPGSSGSYGDALDRFDLSEDEALGFEAFDVSWGAESVEYDVLTAAWRSLIEARRNATAVAR